MDAGVACRCDQASCIKSPTLVTPQIRMLALPEAVSEGKCDESRNCCLGQQKSHVGFNFNNFFFKCVPASSWQFGVHFTVVNEAPSHSKLNRDKEGPCNCQREKRVL